MAPNPSFTKELTWSYLSGGALALPLASFGDRFPETTTCVLRNAAEKEWGGKITRRMHVNAERLEVTAGWGKFAKANGLRVGDEIRLEFRPPSVLLVSVLKHGTGPTAEECAAKKNRQVAERSHAAKGGSPLRRQQKPQKQQQQQQKGRQKGQKRKRQQQESEEEEDGGEAAEARPPQRKQQQRRKGCASPMIAAAVAAEVAAQAAAGEDVQPLVAAQGGPLLVAGESPYIRHSQSPARPRRQLGQVQEEQPPPPQQQQQQQQQRQEEQQQEQQSGQEEEWHDCEADEGGTPYSGQYALHGSSEEEQEAAPQAAQQAAGQAGAAAGQAAHAESGGPVAASSAGESGSEGVPVRRAAKRPRRQQGGGRGRPTALAAAAGGLELGSRSGSQEAGDGKQAAGAAPAKVWRKGQLVVARDPKGHHFAGKVVQLPASPGGDYQLELVDANHSFPVVCKPHLVLAEVPHGLVGWRVEKKFKKGWFPGTVDYVWVDPEDNEWAYHIAYEDGDEEGLDLQDLLQVLQRPGKAGTAGAQHAAAAPGKRRGRPPKQQQQQQQRRQQRWDNEEESAEEEEEEEEEEEQQQAAPRRRPGRPPKQQAQRGQRAQQATLTGGRQRRPASAAAAVLGDASSSGAWVQLEPSAEALEASKQQGGIYEAGGAGHERGVYAWDGKASTMRPVGPWLADKDTVRGTVLGRVGRLDKRHLADREALPGYRSPYVPGWIGVRTVDDSHWTPDYDGQYCVAVYDSHAATFYAVKCSGARFDEVEDAARLYDRIALCYHGQMADTNFPTTQALWQELGHQDEFQASKNCISLAARLAQLEHSIPYEAVDEEVPHEDWHAWEEDLVSNFLCKRPTLSTAAGLAGKLKWLLQQLHAEALFPSYRGAPLQRLLEACDACSAPGNVKDHLAGRSSECYVCAVHRKGSDQDTSYRHGSTNLAALIKEADAAVISQKALQAFHAGECSAAADAAAREDQERLDEVLEAWAGGCPASPAGAAGGGGRGGRPGRPRGGAAALPPAAAAGARALRAAGKYRHIPVEPGLEVIVIGGGVAGLKAAGDLQRGGAEVTVLEARDRLGGRIHTHTLRAGDVERSVDLGATFVCGTDRTPPVNPIFEYAVDVLGLRLQPKHRDGPGATALYDRDGSRIPDDALLAAEEKYNELIDHLHERTEPGSKAPRSETIQEAVQDILSGMELTEQERDTIRAFTVDLYVAEMDQLSLRGMTSQGFAGKHELVVGGFKQVVEALHQGRVAPDLPSDPLRDVRTSSVVTAVRLLPGGVGVEVDVQGQEEPLRAHAVVCTLPLGALQRGSVAFDPPLPEYKQTAIAGLAMGTENRVAMLFDQVFWPAEQHFLRPITGHYTFANMHALGVPNVLSAWVRPEAVDKLEAMSDEEMLADVLASLKKICPDGFHAPLDYTVTRWKQDPYSFGAYSYVPPNGKKAYYDCLGHPVSGLAELDSRQEEAGGRLVELQTRLWFAGEATSKEDAYTVHGAYKTGEVQAVRIKKWWKAHHEQIERLLAEQRQQQQQGEQQVLAAVDGGEAAAGGRRPRAAAATAKQRLASAAADS